ncbi:hypothetical protein P154DRAFT_73930 [Amniculicola lignicola CBS 123094]|uniref:BRCT domain-containing protein n=1 Tax=Amniculicola lignicola CBS 123094 TaxID=1392246 RepID=A0A6A5WPU4_9PLEO|nr:hypothetical protein P154DRAFT_73930 [Amniculicola lignicola CBS 123094]
MVTTRSGREVKSVLAAPPKRAARPKRAREDGQDTVAAAKKPRPAAKAAAKPLPKPLAKPPVVKTAVKSSTARAKPTARGQKVAKTATTIEAAPENPFLEYPVPPTPSNGSIMTGLPTTSQPAPQIPHPAHTMAALAGFPVSEARLFKSPTPEDPFLEFPVWPSTPAAPAPTLLAPTLAPPTAIKSALRSPLKMGLKTPKKFVAFNITPEKVFSFDELDSSILKDGPLNGTIWYVDVHRGKFDESFLFTTLLEDLGAFVEHNWETSNIPPTHILFKDGAQVLLERAARTDGKTKVVNVGYVLECEKQMSRLDEAGYLVPLDGPVKDATPPAEESPESSPVTVKPRKPLPPTKYLLATPARRPSPSKLPPASIQSLRRGTPQPIASQRQDLAISKFAFTPARTPSKFFSFAETPSVPSNLQASTQVTPTLPSVPTTPEENKENAMPETVSKDDELPSWHPSKVTQMTCPPPKRHFNPFAQTPKRVAPFGPSGTTFKRLDPFGTPATTFKRAAPFGAPATTLKRAAPFSTTANPFERVAPFGTTANPFERVAPFGTTANPLKRDAPFDPPTATPKRRALFGPNGPTPKRFRPTQSGDV